MFKPLLLAAILAATVLPAAQQAHAEGLSIDLMPGVSLRIGDQDNRGRYWDGYDWRDRDWWQGHQGRYLGEQAEIEIVKRVVPVGLFVPLRAVSGFDGRTGTIWTVEDGKLNKRLVALGDRLLDGRVLIVDGLPADARAVVSVPDDGFKVGRKAVASESRR